jgi:hypothetical protein
MYNAVLSPSRSILSKFQSSDYKKERKDGTEVFKSRTQEKHRNSFCVNNQQRHVKPTPVTRALLEKLISPQLVQKTRCILRNPKARYRVRNSPPLVIMLSQIQLVQALPTYYFNTRFNTIPHILA